MAPIPKKVNINVDLGEGYGNFKCGPDDELIPLIGTGLSPFSQWQSEDLADEANQIMQILPAPFMRATLLSWPKP